MTHHTPTLHILCGKIASGKSTLAARLVAETNAVLIAEDAWLGALFADQMTTPRDFMRCSQKLHSVMGPHVTGLLQSGVSVVLDFQANTVDARQWLRSIFENSGAAHKLHVIEASDDLCLARLQKRNADGAHEFAATEAQFHQITKHFVPPHPDEGFDIVTHIAKA